MTVRITITLTITVRKGVEEGQTSWSCISENLLAYWDAFVVPLTALFTAATTGFSLSRPRGDDYQGL